MLISEVPVYMRHSLTFEQLPIAVVAGDEGFEVSWVSFMNDMNHFVSAHLMGGHWFYFDDMAGGRASKPCPLTMIDIDNFDHNNYEMQRVFYRRCTETNPHRCIQLASEEEMRRLTA